MPPSTISRNSVGYVGISPLTLQSRWLVLSLVAVLTTAIPYFTIQINRPSLDCNKFKIACATLYANSTNLLLLLLSFAEKGHFRGKLKCFFFYKMPAWHLEDSYSTWSGGIK